MKLQATKKEMKNGYYKIISIGYCDAQHLLKDKNPFAYSAENYGWACDYYDIDRILISTGYQPILEKNTKRDYNLIREYDKKAVEATKEEREKLLNEFIEKCIN